MKEVVPRWSERSSKPTMITTNHWNVASLEKQVRKDCKTESIKFSIVYGQSGRNMVV